MTEAASSGSASRTVPGAADNEGGPMTTMRIAIADGLRTHPAVGKEVEANLAVQQPARRKADRPADGSLTEFADLYNEYFPKVFAYVYGRVQDKEISLDIVSDVFEKAFIKVQS